MKVKTSLTKEQKKIKRNAILASIILGATILTGCPQPVDSVVYPNNLTENDENKIRNTNGSTYSEVLNDIDTILGIGNIPAEYKAQLREVRDALGDQDFIAETYNNLFSDSKIAKQEMKNYNNMSVRSQKSNDNYTNYSAYLELYKDYKSKVESFNNQIEAYNELKSNYDGNYTNYENAYRTLKDADIEKDAYNNLVNFMKAIRDDFKNNYFIDNEENLTPDIAENARVLLDNAIDENNDNRTVDTALASTKTEYDLLKQSVENTHTAKSNIDAAYSVAQDADTKESSFSLEKQPTSGIEGTKVITYAFVDDPSKYEGDDEFILYCRSKATALLGDLSTATDVKINIPTGEVDTQFLYELYTEAKKQNNDVSVEFENPQNTTIGNYWWVTPAIDTTKVEDADKYSNIRNFIELITPESQESPKLSVSLGFYSTDNVNKVNLYHTGIDKLLQKSYNLGMSDDIELINGSLYFDAVDYLTEKGGIAYNEDGSYANNYYDLDVNAALLMNGVAFKNVNINGTLSKNITFGGSFTNTRFDVNSNGKVFEIGCNGSGLIEFAGDTPSVLPVTDKAKLVISNADNENTIILEGGAVIDLTQLPDDGNVSFYNSGNVAYEHAYFKNEEAKQNYIQNGFGNNGTTYSLKNGTSSIPYYATSQQWVDAANANDGKGNFVKTDGGVYMPDLSNLTSKLNLDEKNNKLLDTILYNNQKFYG